MRYIVYRHIFWRRLLSHTLTVTSRHKTRAPMRSGVYGECVHLQIRLQSGSKDRWGVGHSCIASLWRAHGTGVDPTQPVTQTRTRTRTRTRTKTNQKRTRNAATPLSYRTRKFADNSELGPRFRSADHDYSIIKTKTCPEDPY